ncbi:MAG: GNAT family N-acetyltransferase [Euryarchaeota archaeon]|nr:GNAT family N-acetyltransferase [Euryarchaeota archaeon]MBT4050613.1 GNAT family N-acetyltransferase [Euryarchaeota archaeon]MBT5509099.1 GNAT family N-acetyltransferase [Euryarchaeota archaeon]
MFKIAEDIANSKNISKGLIEFNISKIGKLPYKEANIYLFSDGEMKGIAFSESGWNNIEIRDIWVDDVIYLNPLLEKVKEIHSEIAAKITVFTHDSDYVKHLIVLGYELVCTIPDMPKNGNYYGLLNDKPFSTSSYKFSTNKIYLIKAKKILNEYYKSFNLEKKQYFVYSIKKNDLLVGGIKGSFSNNYASIDTIWVDEPFRKQYLGVRLMKYIENVAMDKGINNLLLSTCTFQAKIFYEKLGYMVVGVIKEVPIGSDDHIMTKKI